MPYSQPLEQSIKPKPQWRRTFQAISRDTSALVREFRTPILIFLFVTFVGGYFYGELHYLAYQETIPLFDRPYIMVQLMILATPAEYSETPDAVYLMLFWYLLPPIFVFIVGNGVVDFVRLFFDRSGRRDAWRRAVISTMRDHVIVLGAGHVGVRVVRWLYRLGVDVVVIDNSVDPEAEAELNTMGTLIVHGDARNPAIMKEAGIERAEAFIACTGDDPVNLYAIMRARDMNKNLRIVVRVWDDQFATQIEEFIINTGAALLGGQVKGVLSSSELAAPIFAGMALGVEITQSLTVSGADYSTMRIVVHEGSFMDGRTVGELQNENDVDIVLHVQKGVRPDVKPAHDARVAGGDTLVMFAEHERLLQIAARNRNGR